jgi:hypothetical protein
MSSGSWLHLPFPTAEQCGNRKPYADAAGNENASRLQQEPSYFLLIASEHDTNLLHVICARA